MLSGGTATPATAYALQSVAQAKLLFGAGSQAAAMAWAFLKANPYTRVDIMGVADAGGGSHANGSITPSGTATVSGTINLLVAGQSVSVGVSVGDSLTVIKANIIADINANVDLPITANAGSSNMVNIVTKHAGYIADVIDVRVNFHRGETLPAGLALAVYSPTGGATNPTLTACLAAASATWYTDLVLPFYDNDGGTAAWLDANFTAMSGTDCYAYNVSVGTYGTQLTGAVYLNSRFRTSLAVNNAPQPPWVWGASLAGVCALARTNDPARQVRGKVLPGILAPADADLFNAPERNILLQTGLSTTVALADGTVAIERVITENRTDSAGIATTAWMDATTVWTLSRVRFDWKTFTGVQYPNAKLADDGSLAAEWDPATVTPSTMKGSWASRSNLYEKQGWLENTFLLAQQSYFGRDASSRNRLDSRQPIQVIGNLMVLAGALEFQA
jgi:phage tail sheath gpL-like